MSGSRFTLLPDDRFTVLVPALEDRLQAIGRSLTAADLSSLLDQVMRQTMDFAFRQAGAHEGAVWLAEEATKSLTPVFDSGPHAQQFVGSFKQPLSSGVISMVFASEQPFVENEVFRNSRHDKSLDNLLKVQTYAMIAIPLYFLDACRGVVSCVQLKVPDSTGPNPPGFTQRDQAVVRYASTTLGRLIDHRILRATFGLR